MIDLSKLTTERKSDIINPLAIFSSLPNKSEKYNGYLRNVQGEVLNQWFELRNNKDNIIKMNTGSGKTTVALLILQSCLNEQKGNAVYVVRDNFLIQQVKYEAKDLGIKIVENEQDIDFLKNKAILVISIQKLINGRTVFDERNHIDNIIIDDVHACLDTAEQQFIIKIMRDKHSQLYDDIFNLFKRELQRQNHINAINIEDKIMESNPMLVPFWEVKSKYKKILEFINKYQYNEIYNDIFFPFSFLNDIIQYCNISIAYNVIEISPDCLPIYKVSAFNDAKRRIFISATLKDDGKLINSFNLDKNNIEKIITPSQALDIGNRMILFPQAINPHITDDDLKQYLKKISLDKRIVVIVPSNRRAEYWKDVADHIFNKENIKDIKNYTIGLDILVNRYDGIDLKGKLCSYLVIDGLPNAKSLFEQITESLLCDTSKSNIDKIQKIEQGMGRGIRSNQDDCAVVIMGKQLLNIIYNDNALESFSFSTSIQYSLSEQIADQLKNEPLESIMNTFDLCLNKDSDWITVMNKALSDVTISNSLNYKEEDLELNKAFNIALKGNYQECFNIIQKLVNNENTEQKKGYLMFYLAKYKCFIDEVESQKILLSAKQYNRNLILPLNGFDVKQRKLNKTIQSSKIMRLYREKYKEDMQLYLYAFETHFSNLIFSENTYKDFEKAINDVGELLGFDVSMPDSEFGEGPDNIWYLNDTSYMIIECKNESQTETISKEYCGQLCMSDNWAKEKYGNDNTFYPIIVHKSNTFSRLASPNDNFRIITEENINKLSENIRLFCNSMISTSSINEQLINECLVKYRLDYKNIIDNYTSQFIKEKN